MAAAFTIKVGDLLPVLRATLTQGLAQDPIDLTGADVLLRWRVDGKNELHTRAATIVDAVNGIVEVEWTADDTAEAAFFQAEFVITFDPLGTPKQQTVPNEGCFTIEIASSCGSTC